MKITQRQRGPGQTGPGYPSTSFLCLWFYDCFPIPQWNFFANTYFKVITLCDEFIRYWNNGLYLSNQVNGNTGFLAKKVPGTRDRVNMQQKIWRIVLWITSLNYPHVIKWVFATPHLNTWRSKHHGNNCADNIFKLSSLCEDECVFI